MRSVEGGVRQETRIEEGGRGGQSLSSRGDAGPPGGGEKAS